MFDEKDVVSRDGENVVVKGHSWNYFNDMASYAEKTSHGVLTHYIVFDTRMGRPLSSSGYIDGIILDTAYHVEHDDNGLAIIGARDGNVNGVLRKLGQEELGIHLQRWQEYRQNHSL